MPLSEDRRAGLNETKLLALIANRAGTADPSWTSAAAASAMAIVDGHLYIYLAEPTRQDLGAAMVRVASQGADALTIFVDDTPESTEVAGTLARRATYYSVEIGVAVVRGRETSPATASPFDVTGPPSPAAEALTPMLVDAGLDIIAEHGVIKGEVLGLEVARVVGDDAAAAGARVEVGIGRFDREIAQMMHGDFVTVDHVVAAAELVRAHRYPGAPIHPLRDLMRERWMRTLVLANPSLVGCERAVATESSTAPANLRDRLTAMVAGSTDTGAATCVGVTAGIDLDAVTEAADSRARAGMTGDWTMVVTSGDLLPSVRAAAALLAEPPTFVECDSPW